MNRSTCTRIDLICQWISYALQWDKYLYTPSANQNTFFIRSLYLRFESDSVARIDENKFLYDQQLVIKGYVCPLNLKYYTKHVSCNNVFDIKLSTN